MPQTASFASWRKTKNVLELQLPQFNLNIFLWHGMGVMWYGVYHLVSFDWSGRATLLNPKCPSLSFFDWTRFLYICCWSPLLTHNVSVYLHRSWSYLRSLSKEISCSRTQHIWYVPTAHSDLLITSASPSPLGYLHPLFRGNVQFVLIQVSVHRYVQ